jgi:predicted MFS family arabinose efflux permease
MLNPVAPFRVALRHRDLRILFAGQLASDAGDWLYNVALLALVYERTGSSALLGATTAARMLPLVVLGPLGGVLADRVDRRALMVASDVARAACMLALAAVALSGAPVLLAPALAALSTAAGAAYPPCVLALIPRLAGDDDLPAANAARTTIMHLCIVIGPVLGAGLLVVGSTAVAFLVNASTFLAGGAAVASLPRAALRRPEAAAEQPGVRAGWQALRGYPDALPLVGAHVVASAAYGALTVLFVLLGERLGLGAAGYGYLVAALGAGAVLAAGVAERAAALGRPRLVLAAAVAALGAPLPIAIAGWLPGALLVAAVFGAGTLVSEVAADTALQRSLDPAVFARAYGLVLPAALAGIALGALLAPPCVELVGLDGTLLIVAAACVAYGAVVGASARTRGGRVALAA